MNRYSKKLWPITQTDVSIYAAVFLVYLFVSIFSLYVFITFHTSPALIWPAVGIGTAAVILFGYRMWVIIFLAQYIAVVTQVPGMEVLAFGTAAGYALQAVVARYVFSSLHFESAFEKVRNVLIFVGGSFFITVVEPTVATALQAYAGTFISTPQLYWMRAWGAGVFSVLIYTPFILFWFPPFKMEPLLKKERIELLAAFTLLAVINYFVFWTDVAQHIGISVIFLLPAVLIWFALRLHPRWLTLATFVTSIQGVAGMLLTPSSASPLNEQLLAAEIYICLVAAIFYVFAAVVDERRIAFKKLQRAYEITSASDKAKNEFIAILAHELRNPLAPIVSALELLQTKKQDPESVEIISNISQHAFMMRRLLDDLLDLARLSQDKIQLHREKISIAKLIRESLSSVRDHAKEKQVTLQTNTPNEDIEFEADPIRIKQILINLLNNACKYSKPGTRVTVEYGRQQQHVFITVRDTGIGIKPELMENIFEPFRQLANGSNYGTGLGIGLFLTKKLVEMHNGTIEVFSAGTDQGTTFTIRFPLPEAVPQEDLLPAPQQYETSSIGKPQPVTAQKRILIVDDNEAAANILQKLLRLNHYEVEVAYSGKQALSVLHSFNPAVILLDIGMPGMDGYEVAQALRQEHSWNGNIIALSGYGQDSDKERSKQAGFNHHLVKPVGIEDIQHLLLRV